MLASPSSRDIRISDLMKFLVYNISPGEVDFQIVDGSTLLVQGDGAFFSVAEPASYAALQQQAVQPILDYATAHSYSITEADILWPSGGMQPARVVSNPSLAVNTARQASTTRDALVIASVEIDAALSLSGGAKGTVSLQYADNNTFTTNLKTASVGVNGNTGTLTIGLNTTQAGGGVVVGIVPAGKYYRLFTTNTTGTPTFGTPAIQEVLM